MGIDKCEVLLANIAKTHYQKWIEDYLAGLAFPGACLGRCQEAVQEMAVAFPELRVVRGHVYCAAPWGKRAHWWCETDYGQIVDPTAAQFSVEIFEYEEYTEGAEVRIGRCMNCGEEIWGKPEKAPQQFCGSECHDGLAAEMNANSLSGRGYGF